MEEATLSISAMARGSRINWQVAFRLAALIPQNVPLPMSRHHSAGVCHRLTARLSQNNKLTHTWRHERIHGDTKSLQFVSIHAESHLFFVLSH